MVLTFDKYKGKDIQGIMNFDPAYIGWCIVNKTIEIDSKTKKKTLKAFDEENAISEVIIDSIHSDWGSCD